MSVLEQYETDYLGILNLVALYPGLKTGTLANKLNISPSSVLRYSAELENDGWLERRQDNRADTMGVRAAFAYFPRARLRIEDVNVILIRRLKQLRKEEKTHEYFALLEIVQGPHPARVALEDLTMNLRTAASAIQMMSTEVLKLENYFGNLPENGRNR